MNYWFLSRHRVGDICNKLNDFIKFTLPHVKNAEKKYVNVLLMML